MLVRNNSSNILKNGDKAKNESAAPATTENPVIFATSTTSIVSIVLGRKEDLIKKVCFCYYPRRLLIPRQSTCFSRQNLISLDRAQSAPASLRMN